MWAYSDSEPREIPSLVLAYVGDAVFELYVRMHLVSQGARKVKDLHGQAAGLVRAGSQADFLHKLEPLLSEEEKEVARRGRNAKSGSVPKNADVVVYRVSTGFEALLGYLFLARREERLQYLLDSLFRQ